MDDALKADYGEQTTAYGGGSDEAQDNNPEQASSIAAGRMLEQLPVIYGGSHVCRRS